MDKSTLSEAMIGTVFPLVMAKLVDDGRLDAAIEKFLDLEEEAEEFAQRFSEKAAAARAFLHDELERIGGSALLERVEARRSARRSERLTVRDDEEVIDPPVG